MSDNHISTQKGASALEVTDVSHAYGAKKALAGVSFFIPAGRFTVLLGLNGAGKTTLFSLISRLYDTQDGSIRIFGRDIRRDPSEALRRLGIVFQARTLDLDLSIAQNLTYHAALHGFGRREAMARIIMLLDTVGLADRLHDKAKNLSGGQMRRVEIVRALLHRPSLLLLDEATVGLDVQARADILATIRALVRDDGIGVLWATHLIDEVMEDDDVVILDGGRVLASGAVGDVVRAAGAQDIAGAFGGLVSETGARMVISPLEGGVPGRAEGGHVSKDSIVWGMRRTISQPPLSDALTSAPQRRESERPRPASPSVDLSSPKAGGRQ
ncbi:ATP-binding cassette domain-containing protein [Rhizobiales bacterium RZME27]|uniref:ATP-binding cassette domain-containing protein n=1 Tax=Endobacterium cereale TaxID=2663029 RepID=A0A6A8AGK6_9HYPH|nr:ATP-binding cassette domain-containing protein [Endobacterium cereale]